MVVTAVVKYRQKLITSRCLWVLSQTVKQIFRMAQKILIFLKFNILSRLLLLNLNFNLFFIDSVYPNFIQVCLNRKSTLEMYVFITTFSWNVNMCMTPFPCKLMYMLQTLAKHKLCKISSQSYRTISVMRRK